MQKLSARERRHKAVLNKIARLTLARNKGIKAIVAAETQLPALLRQARRNELPVKPRKPKPVEHPKVTARERKVADTLVSDVTDIPVSEMRDDDLQKTAHMQALGFRKLPRSRRSKKPDADGTTV